MTGLHGLHVIVGMGLLVWLLTRAAAGDFHSEHFGPVDFVGLYWHLVDLVWIYLFPLLYLIR
jgi:cytochrome c oxidase subunit 3